MRPTTGHNRPKNIQGSSHWLCCSDCCTSADCWFCDRTTSELILAVCRVPSSVLPATCNRRNISRQARLPQKLATMLVSPPRCLGRGFSASYWCSSASYSPCKQANHAKHFHESPERTWKDLNKKTVDLFINCLRFCFCNWKDLGVFPVV